MNGEVQMTERLKRRREQRRLRKERETNEEVALKRNIIILAASIIHAVWLAAYTFIKHWH